jgi:hypothetical protein
MALFSRDVLHISNLTLKTANEGDGLTRVVSLKLARKNNSA